MLIRNEYKPQMVSKTEQKDPILVPHGRLSTLVKTIAGVFVLVAGSGLLLQNVDWQQFGVREANFAKDIQDRTQRIIREPALRGMITDRNGTVLAVSHHLKVAVFNPKRIYIRDPNKTDEINQAAISDEQFAELANILKLPESEIREKLQNIKLSYVHFPTELSLEDMDKLKKLKIPTLRFEERTERNYPTDNLFSHIIGFSNSKGVGLEGLELSKNKYLTGEDGMQMAVRDARGRFVELVDSDQNKPAKNGGTLVLSLDYDMQRLAHNELAAALRRFNAKAGGVVVLDAKTGEILAMSSLPDYNANHYQNYPQDNLRNFSVGVTMEPGSVMKPFVVAKALDEGKITRNTVFNTHSYQLGNKTIRDTHDYPSLTTQGIIQKSSNVGTSRIAAMFPNEDLFNYFSSVGFGRKTNSGVSGEQYRPIKPAEKWGKLDKAVMSYGYTINANLLQLAQGYTIFTADGKLMPATVFKQEKMPQGTQIISPATAKIMREMMVSVTEKGGTGQAGAVEGFDVAAKTGTAKKLVNGSYEGNKYRASFVGFAPAQNPRLIVAVTIDEPSGNGYYGGTVAGPVFKGVMSGGLKLLGVKPTYADAG